MPALPVEILRSIFEHLDDNAKSLLNVLLSCRRFSQIAEPLLYTQVTIRGAYFGYDPSMTAKLKSLLEAIEADGRRALYVHSLLFRARIGDDEQVQLIDTIVIKLKKLKILSLPFYYQSLSSPAITVPFNFIQQSPPFSLKEFRYPDATSDQVLARFLGSQPSLETLQFIWDSAEAPDFPPAALPNLKTVMCNLAVFSHLAHSPARITHLAITDLDETPWESTVAFTNRIRALSLTLSDAHEVRVLVRFASVFPNLQWLEIAGSPDINKCLRKFCKYYGNERIRGIRFREPYRTSGEPRPYDVFEALEALEFVEYHESVHDEYRRWYCDEGESKRVKWRCENDSERWRGDWEKDVSEVKVERPTRGSTPTRWRPYHAYGWPGYPTYN